jgi:crossover junction endodeoxyribonuclease RusA
MQVSIPFPPSVNHYWRHVGGRVYISDRGMAYRQAVGFACLGMQPLTGEVAVIIEVTAPDRRRRDLDNLLKASLDALSGWLWHDDAQIADLHIRWARERVKKPGALKVSVRPLSA